MIHINLDYNLDDGTYKLDTNLKPSKVSEIIYEFLRTQMGAGKDSTKPTDDHQIKIQIGLDLRDDSFTVGGNYGNKGLRDGILLEVAKLEDSKKGTK